MPYITSIQRIGREEGREEGRQEGLHEGRIEALRQAIAEMIEVRFGSVPTSLRARVELLSDPDKLQAWHRLAVRSASLAEVEEKLSI